MSKSMVKSRLKKASTHSRRGRRIKKWRSEQCLLVEKKSLPCLSVRNYTFSTLLVQQKTAEILNNLKSTNKIITDELRGSHD